MRNVRNKRGYTGPRVRDTQTFIKKSLWKHGDVYDYSLVEYTKSSGKVTIICRKHGEFSQVANDHVNAGAGCRACKYEYMQELLSHDKDIFVEKATNKHSGKYTYENVIYSNNRTKVLITCPSHGEFLQSPDGHLRGEGCPACKSETIGNLWRKSKEDFIAQAKEIHGDKFDYSRVSYVNTNTKVEIGCPKHGTFLQSPYSHLRATDFGCNDCWREAMSDTLTTSQVDFESAARAVHGDKYIYGEFSGYASKMEITCPEHGEFVQLAQNHVNAGSGCPQCSLLESQGWGNHKRLYSSDDPSHLYVIRMTGREGSFLKVGLAKNPVRRHKLIEYQSECSVEPVALFTGPANKLFVIEHHLLHKSSLIRYKPKVSFGGCSECVMDGSQDDIVMIIEELGGGDVHEVSTPSG